MSGAIKECRIMKNVIPGEVYAIPLFLTDIHPMTRVSLKDLRGDDKKFAYCRIIEDRGSGGILVEVFNKVGTLDISIEEVVESMRLFPPQDDGLSNRTIVHMVQWPHREFAPDYVPPSIGNSALLLPTLMLYQNT